MKIFIALMAMIVVLAGIMIVYSISGSRNYASVQANAPLQNNVTIVGGKQIVEIQVKGGYAPRKSFAKAGIPTILRFDTNGTFDCSSAIRIPSMGVSKILPSSGTTDIDVDNPQVGVLQGFCGMGMYHFEIGFQS